MWWKHLGVRPEEVDELPLVQVGWMTDQLAEYESDRQEWLRAEGIGWDDLPAGEPGSHVRWTTRGTDALPFAD